jgi:hypothetical protein
VIEEKHMLANFKIVEMLSDDGAESMNTKQAVAALVRQAFALAAYHPSLSTPSSNKIIQDMVMSFCFP